MKKKAACSSRDDGAEGRTGARSIKVIALTALAMKGDEEKMLAAGCDGYLAKPFEYQEFLAWIEAALAAGPR